MSPSQLLTLIHCRDSFEYFCESQLGITPPTIKQGEQNEAGVEQSLAYILWQAIFQPLRTHLVVSTNVQSRRERAAEFGKMLDSLPSDLYIGLLRSRTKERYEFSDGSLVKFLSGPNAGKGHSISTLCFDGTPSDDTLAGILPCTAATRGTVIFS
jgi:hypothetical protein